MIFSHCVVPTKLESKCRDPVFTVVLGPTRREQGSEHRPLGTHRCLLCDVSEGENSVQLGTGKRESTYAQKRFTTCATSTATYLIARNVHGCVRYSQHSYKVRVHVVIVLDVNVPAVCACNNAATARSPTVATRNARQHQSARHNEKNCKKCVNVQVTTVAYSEDGTEREREREETSTIHSAIHTRLC